MLHRMRVQLSLSWLLVVRASSAFLTASTPKLTSPHHTSKLPPVVYRMASSDTTNRATDQQRQQQLPPISSRIQTTLDPCVVLMKDLIGKYADRWQGDKGGIYSLAQGVVYWKPPESCQEALQEAILSSPSSNSDLHLYGPDEGLPEFRALLQEKVAVENGLTHHDIMVTVGANQAYVNCVLTLLSERDKAVVFAPYYFNHVMALQMSLSSKEEHILIGPTSNAGFPDLTWLEQQLAIDSKYDKSIRMVTLVNPGNPTGAALPREFVQQMVDLTRKYSCWLILDAVYEYFLEDAMHDFDACFNDEPHVLHIFSFSKAYALAGYRCGYIAIHKDSRIYEQMLKVQDTIPIAPSRISQVAAMGAMRSGRAWVKNQVATLETGRNAILKALEPLESVMGGSGAMYVMGKLPDSYKNNDQQVADLLVRDYGVAVIPGSFCGFDGWIRVCYANLPPDQCLQAAARLERGILDIVNGKV